jgi:hypothetical protein
MPISSPSPRIHLQILFSGGVSEISSSERKFAGLWGVSDRSQPKAFSDWYGE